ncbi:hypothetical protein EGW08_020900 [Elysia chlorotica]|uniref:Uncharacterized protein n=1 Tax=Elysia chlorotica TaxID=188477 RepID=A0A3S1H373_ELYCH|nr:hypothetical protein EGW08_020900 [Elysia chlorotica]
MPQNWWPTNVFLPERLKPKNRGQGQPSRGDDNSSSQGASYNGASNDKPPKQASSTRTNDRHVSEETESLENPTSRHNGRHAYDDNFKSSETSRIFPNGASIIDDSARISLENSISRPGGTNTTEDINNRPVENSNLFHNGGGHGIDNHRPREHYNTWPIGEHNSNNNYNNNYNNNNHIVEDSRSSENVNLQTAGAYGLALGLLQDIQTSEYRHLDGQPTSGAQDPLSDPSAPCRSHS